MGRLRDKWFGTQYPDSDVAPLSAAEVRDALLAVNSPHVPYRVRNAATAERADLAADWWVNSSAFGERKSQKLKIRMRLDPSLHEVRILQERWVTTKSSLSVSKGYCRGPGFTAQWTFERGPDGRRHKVKTLDTRDMRNALRKVVLSSGWTWRGVSRASKL